MTARFTVHVDDKTAVALRATAAQQGVSVDEIIVKAIETYGYFAFAPAPALTLRSVA